MSRLSDSGTGATEFQIAVRLGWVAWLVMALQEFLLFVRPTPFGGAYVRAWTCYFGRALFYNFLGVSLVILPFLIGWLVRYRRPAGPVPAAGGTRHRSLNRR